MSFPLEKNSKYVWGTWGAARRNGLGCKRRPLFTEGSSGIGVEGGEGFGRALNRKKKVSGGGEWPGGRPI